MITVKSKCAVYVSMAANPACTDKTAFCGGFGSKRGAALVPRSRFLV